MYNVNNMVKRIEQCDLVGLSGASALEAILDIVENGGLYTIATHPIDHISSLEHGNKPRDIIVTAGSVGNQILKFAFGSDDEPVIDYTLQVLGSQ